MSWLIDSSIGRKFVQSISGLFLILFLLFHMSMNLVLIFNYDAYDFANEVKVGANWWGYHRNRRNCTRIPDSHYLCSHPTLQTAGHGVVTATSHRVKQQSHGRLKHVCSGSLYFAILASTPVSDVVSNAV